MVTPKEAIENFGDKIMGNEVTEVEPNRYHLVNNAFPDTDDLFFEIDGDTIRVFNENNNELFVVKEPGVLSETLRAWHSIDTEYL